MLNDKNIRRKERGKFILLLKVYLIFGEYILGKSKTISETL